MIGISLCGRHAFRAAGVAVALLFLTTDEPVRAAQAGGSTTTVAAAIAPAPGLSFGKDGYSWTTGGLSKPTGEPVEIRNDTPTDATVSAALTVTGLGIVGQGRKPGTKESPGKESRDRSLVLYNAGPFVVPAGSSVVLHFKLAQKRSLPEGIHDGSLTVFRSGSRTVARTSVSVTDAPVADMTPANATQTIQGIRWIPFLDRVGDYNLVQLRGNWVALKTKAPDPPALTKGALLGGVAGNKGGVAAVRFTGHTNVLPSGLTGLETDARGFDGRPGNFTGKIDLTSGKDGDEIDLTVVVTDAIIWAIAALSIGIGAALWFRRWRQAGRVILQLAREESATRKDYAAALAELRATTGQPTWSGFDTETDFVTRADALRTSLRELAGKHYFKLPDADRNALLGELDALAAAVKDLKSVAETAQSLIDALVTANAVAWPAGLDGTALPPHPTWVQQAPELLDPAQGADPSTIDGLQMRLKAIKAATAAATAFPVTAEQIDRDVQHLEELARAAAGHGPSVAAVEKACRALGAAWRNLWLAQTVEQATAKEIADAIVVASRWVRGIVFNRDGAGIAAAADRFDQQLTAGAFPAELDDAVAPMESALAPLVSASNAFDDPPVDIDERIKHFDKAIRKGDRWMVVFAWAVAVTTGLIALYFDKTFGTPSDYLLALLWGGTTAATVDALADVVGLRAGPSQVLRDTSPAAPAGAA